jgi:hypothetical protein
MKTVAAIIASLVLSVVTFSIGVFGAILYLSAPEPASLSRTTEVADLWTTEPTVVARNQHQLERAAAHQISASHTELGSLSNGTVEERVLSDAKPDGIVTSSIAEEPNERSETLFREHVQWCMSRYNSYRPDDGTYQPYRGKRRLCVSPYIAVDSEVPLEEKGTADEVLSSARRALGDTVVTEIVADLDSHAYSCSKRYRSYRAEDNSYQPFDGGPRRQCR